MGPLFRAAVSTLNTTGRIFGLNAALTPEALMARAQRVCGLSDFGDPDFREGLQRLCESIARDAHPSTAGSIALRDFITGALVTRLRLRATDVPHALPVAPLIVMGLPRSGTTHLHRLLSLAPDARALEYWELREPVAGPGADRRITTAETAIQRLLWLRPGIRAKHDFGAHVPEECVLLHDSSLWAPTAWRLAPVYDYVEWLLSADPTQGYREYARHVRRLAAQTPQRRMTLKNPDHTGFLRALLDAVPNARVVQTHRDPMAVIPSYNSLMASVHSTITTSDPRRSADMSMKWWGEAVDRNVAQRDGIDVFDLRYDDLVGDPIGSVRAIHRHFDLPFDDAYEETLRDAVSARPQHQHGKHTYDLESFGLTETRIRDRFAAYSERFL